MVVTGMERHPADNAAGLWLGELGDLAPRFDSAPGMLDVDVAVIGGGVTGLSTALHLKAGARGIDVAVLEGERVGSGGSGRSTGALTPLPERRWAAKLARDGLEETERAGAFQAAGVVTAHQLVAKSGVDCRLTQPGYLMVGGERHRRSLQREAEAMAAVGLGNGEVIEGTELRELIDQSYWQVAVRSPASWLDPARYVVALARLGDAHGVRIHEHSPVTRLSPGMPAELHLSEGRVIRAPAVVLATDGFTPALGFLRRYVYALHTCAVATEPLTSETLSSMGWHGREIVFEAARTGHTFLLTPDNRVLCRGLSRYGFRDSLAPVDQKRIRGALGTAITERFPKLAGVPLEYAWSGVIGMTRTYRPAIGRLDAPGEVLHAVGYSGHGLAYGTLAGRLLAELHLGQSSSELEYALEHSLPKRLPPEPFRWLGFHGATRWMRGSEK